MSLSFRRYLKLLIMVAIFNAENAAFSKSPKSVSVRLDFNKIHHLQIPAVNNITALLVDDTELISLPNTENVYLVTKYNSSAFKYNAEALKQGAFDNKASDEISGTRFTLDETVGKAKWRGVSRPAKDALLLLDGHNNRMIAYNLEANSFISSHTIVMDLLKPAKDSRGEPTEHETANFRGQLIKNLTSLRTQKVVSIDPISDRKKLKRTMSIGVYHSGLDQFQSAKIEKALVPITGMTPLPPKWREGEKAQYLLATQIKGFPVVTMYCSREALSNCQLLRGCFMDKAATLPHFSIAGIAVSKKRRMVLIGDSINHRLLAFHYQSCHHLQLQKTIDLPDEISELNALYIDNEDNLWITTAQPDILTDASLYMWRSTDW